MKKIYVVETNEAKSQKKEFWTKIVAKIFFQFFEILSEVMFESDHSHILRKHALEYPSQHIFFLNFLKGGGGNNVKKK